MSVIRPAEFISISALSTCIPTSETDHFKISRGEIAKFLNPLAFYYENAPRSNEFDAIRISEISSRKNSGFEFLACLGYSIDFLFRDHSTLLNHPSHTAAIRKQHQGG